MKAKLHRLLRHCRSEKGIALLLVLSIMALFLILAMSFAFNARTERASAGNYAMTVRARLIAESGASRVMSFLKDDLATRQFDLLENTFSFPEAGFHIPTAIPDPVTAAWSYRPLLISVDAGNPNIRPSLDTAVSTVINGGQFVPVNNDTTAFRDYLGWTIVEGNPDRTGEIADISGETPTAIGRFTYLVFSTGGLLDPTACVADATAEGSEVRVGASPAEINLGYVFTSNPVGESFRTQLGANTDSWFSYTHIYLGNRTNAVANSDSVARCLFPNLAPDPEQYWLDLDGDNTIAASEMVDRIQLDQVDVAGGPTAIDLYDAFVGYDATTHTTRDDTAKFSEWLQSYDDSGSHAELRRRAAQTAANLVGYADNDDVASAYYIGTAYSAGSDTFPLYDGLPPDSNFEFIVREHEVGWHVGEYLAMIRLERTGVDAELIVTPQFQVELYHASDASAGFNGNVRIEYSFQITPFSGVVYGESNAVVTLTAAEIDQSGSTSNGIVRWNGTLKNGTVYTHPDAFTNASPKPVTLDYFHIHRITILDSAGTTVEDEMPKTASTTLDDYQGVTVTGNMNKDGGGNHQAYFRLIRRLTDPATNWADRYLFPDDYLAIYSLRGDSGDGMIMSTNGTEYYDPPYDIGALNTTSFANAIYSTWYYDRNGVSTASYGDVEIANAPFTRVGQLGRVHSFRPSQSLRLWSVSGDEDNHDAYLLDMFKIGTKTATRGKVNLNSQVPYVLQALLSGTGTAAGGFDLATATAAAAALRTRTRPPAPSPPPVLTPWQYQTPLSNIGDLGSVVGLSGGSTASASEDWEAETRIEHIAELVTVRQNAYIILVTAQALEDLGDNNVPGSVLWQESPDPLYARIVGEQRIMVTLLHDAYTNEFRIARFEYLNE